MIIESHYLCEICGRRYVGRAKCGREQPSVAKQKAQRCEARGIPMPRYKVGDKVRFKESSLYYEGGVEAVEHSALSVESSKLYRGHEGTAIRYTINYPGVITSFAALEKDILGIVLPDGKIRTPNRPKRAYSWAMFQKRVYGKIKFEIPLSRPKGVPRDEA